MAVAKLTTEQRVRGTVENRLMQYLNLKQQQKALAEQIERLKEKVNTDLLEADGTIETADFKAILVNSTNISINAEKLLALGVKPSIVRRATVTTAPSGSSW